MLWSVLVSHAGASHRVNLIGPFTFGQHCPRKIAMKNSQLNQSHGVSYLNHRTGIPGTAFFFHPAINMCVLFHMRARIVNMELEQIRGPFLDSPGNFSGPLRHF